jgi:hypothetical protein
MDPMDELIDVSEAAKILGVRRRLLDAWRHQGVGPPYYKIGNRIMHKRRDIHLYREACRVERQPPRARGRPPKVRP